MDHSNQKCEGYDDVSGKLYFSRNLFVLLDTEYFQVKGTTLIHTQSLSQ